MQHFTLFVFMASAWLLPAWVGTVLGGVPSAATVDARLTQMVQDNVDNPWPDPLSANPETRKWGLPCYALSALYLNQDVQTANDYINAWYTEFPVLDSATIEANADFKLHLFWRMYLHPDIHPRLHADTRDHIEEMMWNWIRQRSRLADAQGTEWVYHGSENHDAMQKGSYLLCTQALMEAGNPYGPDRMLADGHTISEHAAGWNDYFLRYFRGRAREGINAEIASPIYAKYSVGVYYNIRDFAVSDALRNLAEQFITLYWADTASDWISTGVRAGGQTRCYKDNYLRAGTSYSFHELLWGYGWHSRSGTVRTDVLHPATSTYRVPDIITACATDTQRPNYLYTSRRWGRTSRTQGQDNFVTFDNGDSSIRRDTWVTPDYAMGSLTFDMSKDYLQILDQNRAMGILFSSGVQHRVMVYGKGASDDNKSYADLSGVCREDFMVVQRDKNANNSGNGTMIFVAQDLWDTRVETNGWLFLQAGGGYCAVRPATGGYSAVLGQRGFDLELDDPWAPVLLQAGQSSKHASFQDFQDSVQENQISYANGILNYTSEAGDTFTVYSNSRTTPKVNGTTLDLNPAKTYDSPYLSMVHGADVATVKYPGFEDLVLDFGSGPMLMSLDPGDGGSVPAAANLTATFDNMVFAGTGSIHLKRASDHTTVESFDVTTSARLTFSGNQLSIDPTHHLSIGDSYYVLLDSTAVQDYSGRPFEGITDPDSWNFSVVAWMPLATGSRVDLGPLGDSTSTLSWDAGEAADLLVVALSHEKSSGSYSVSYGGRHLDAAVLGGHADIWYLNLTTNRVAAGVRDLVVDYSGVTTVNGVGIGVVSLSTGGQPMVVHATATGATGSNAVALTTSVGQTFHVASFNANGSGSVSLDAPLVPVFTSGNLGSSRGAVGYAAGVLPGVHEYSWTTGEPRKAVAAAFQVRPEVVTTYFDWIALHPGVGTQTGLGDDPDGDGYVNGVECFLGTPPHEPSSGLVARASSGNTFQFTHPINTGPAADLVAAYRWSRDLLAFQNGSATDGEGTRVDFVSHPDTPAPGMASVIATVTGTPLKCLYVILEVSPKGP